MKPRIAIPVPHSFKPDYAQRSLPQYTRAIELAGGDPIVIKLDQSPAQMARTITACDAVLLPGSSADVDPQKYGAARDAKTADADPARDVADELLLQDAYNLRKPLLAICYGMQTLNVWRTGTLIQDIDTKLGVRKINHEAGREVPRAHTVVVAGDSELGEIVAPPEVPSLSPGEETSEGRVAVEHPAQVELVTNSSHHQAVDVIGDGLRAVARCPDDGIVEAIEGTLPEHFVLGVQWHPERDIESEPASQRIFASLVRAAADWRKRR